MIIVGFGHRSGVGKDTAAKFLLTALQERGLKGKRTSFATKLKDITYDLYKWTGIKRPIEYENNRSLRSVPIAALDGRTMVDLWVDVGEALRKVYPDTWTKWISESEHGCDVLVIPDVRHYNEVHAIKGSGGLDVKITNPRVPVREGKSIDDVLADYTGWASEICNDSDLTTLMSRVCELADRIMELRSNGKSQ